MKTIHTAVAVCSAILLCSTATQAASLNGVLLIDPGTSAIVDTDGTMAYVSGSYFSMGENNPNGNAAMLIPGAAGGIQLGTYQNFVLDPDEPHLYNWDGKTVVLAPAMAIRPSHKATSLLHFHSSALRHMSAPIPLGTNPASRILPQLRISAIASATSARCPWT